MDILNRTKIKNKLSRNTLTYKEKFTYALVTTSLVSLFTLLPSYITYQLFGMWWVLLAFIVLFIFIGLGFLNSKQRSFNKFATQWIALGFPISVTILFYSILIYLGIALILIFILGPKFLELMSIEQLASPNIPVIESFMLKMSNLIYKATRIGPSETMEEGISQKTIDTVVTHARSSLFFMLLALSFLPALWFYVWMHYEITEFNEKRKN